MFEERYAKRYEQIAVPAGLRARTLAAAAAQTAPFRHRPRRWIVAAACITVILLGSTALAATFDLAALLGRLFPDTAQDFAAVNLSDTEQGVTMTLLQANLTEDGCVEMLVELSGVGLTSATAPFFFWSPTFYQASSGTFGYVPLEDREDAPYSHLYRLVLEINKDDPEWHSDDGTLTLMMRHITLGREYTAELHDALDLTALPAAEVHEIAPGEYRLVPGEPIVTMVDGMALCAAGFLPDGRYAIQCRTPLDALQGVSCGASLLRRDGDAAAESSWLPQSDHRAWTDEAYWYTETVYSLSPAELADFRLRTHCYTVSEVLTGDWAITIDVNSLRTAAP